MLHHIVCLVRIDRRLANAVSIIRAMTHDWCIKHLWHIGQYLPDYTVRYSRRQLSSKVLWILAKLPVYRNDANWNCGLYSCWLYSVGKAVPQHIYGLAGGRRGGIAPTHSRPRHWMGWVVSVTPRPRFAPGKGPPVPIGQETGWAPEPVWKQRLEEKSSCPCRGSNTDRPVVRHYTLGRRLTTYATYDRPHLQPQKKRK